VTFKKCWIGMSNFLSDVRAELVGDLNFSLIFSYRMRFGFCFQSKTKLRQRLVAKNGKRILLRGSRFTIGWSAAPRVMELSLTLGSKKCLPVGIFTRSVTIECWDFNSHRYHSAPPSFLAQPPLSYPTLWNFCDIKF